MLHINSRIGVPKEEEVDRRDVDGGVLIDAQMLVDGCPQVVGCKWSVVWVLALGVRGADHLAMLHASAAD